MKLKLQNILHNLNDAEFEKFKWTLQNLKDQNVITKSAMENATRERTVDVLVDSYPSKYWDITRMALEKCGQNDLANLLLNSECCWRQGFRFGCLLCSPKAHTSFNKSMLSLCLTHRSGSSRVPTSEYHILPREAAV